MKACLRWQLRVLGYAWWLILLLPALALLMGWEAAALPGTLLRRGGGTVDPRGALALVLDLRHFFPLAGAVWSSLFLGMDYAAEAQAAALGRGCSRGQVLWSKYLLFLLGCAAISVLEQAFAVLGAVPGWNTLPAPFLLRCFFLRLVLDLGMMMPPAVLCLLGRENVYFRLMGLVYGAALWRLMESHYFLWLQFAEWRTGELWALWPAAALVLSLLCVWALSRRGMDGG